MVNDGIKITDTNLDETGRFEVDKDYYVCSECNKESDELYREDDGRGFCSSCYFGRNCL